VNIPVVWLPLSRANTELLLLVRPHSTFFTGYWALRLSSTSRVPSTAMTTTALTTTDILPSSVPKLLATGLNWTAFSMRFEDAIRAKGLWGHFDGSISKPTVSSPATADEVTALAQWDKDDLSAKALLTH